MASSPTSEEYRNIEFDEKYHKQRSANSVLRRAISSALRGRSQRGFSFGFRLLILCTFFFLAIVSIANRRTVSVNVDIEYQDFAVSNELSSLGVGDKATMADVALAQQAEKSLLRQQEAERENEAVPVDNHHVEIQEPQEEEDVARQEEDEEGDETSEDFIAPPDVSVLDMTPMQLFENYKEYLECKNIFLPAHMRKMGEWWGVKAYFKLYGTTPIKNCVPKLRPHIQLTKEEFTEKFRRWGQPVLLRFENLRKIGFTTRSYTMDELLDLFPVDPTKHVVYEANKKYKKDEELELGPAIRAFKDDGKLEKKGVKRNFPRNMKVRASAMSRLGVQVPPLVEEEGTTWQSPSLWMGTSSSGTAFHHDCCDNFVMQIYGTKRFTLAPPTDWHTLSPRCIGKLKNLCYANIPEPNVKGTPSSHYNKMVVDVNPGDILYMPAGFFHHIENMGPTLMVNVWTRSKQSLGILSCNKKRM